MDVSPPSRSSLGSIDCKHPIKNRTPFPKKRRPVFSHKVVFRSFGGKSEPLGETHGSSVLLHEPIGDPDEPELNDPSAENNDRNGAGFVQPDEGILHKRSGCRTDRNSGPKTGRTPAWRAGMNPNDACERDESRGTAINPSIRRSFRRNRGGEVMRQSRHKLRRYRSIIRQAMTGCSNRIHWRRRARWGATGYLRHDA